MSSNVKKIMLDSRIFLSYMEKKGVEYKEVAEKLIQAIFQGKLEATVLLEDLLGCYEFLTKEEYLKLSSKLERKITTFSYHKEQVDEFCKNFQMQMDSLRLKDPRNTYVLASFLAFNQTSLFKKKFDALVTFNPQDYYNYADNIISVNELLDDLSKDSPSKKERLNKQFSKNTRVSYLPAQINAAVRGYENLRKDALFEDKWSFVLAGENAHFIINRLNMNDERPYIAVRTCYVDDLVRSRPEDIKQIIIVGAGMDTRSLRLNFSSDTVIFELDQKSLLDDKKRKLDLFGATFNCKRYAIPVDLTQCNWIESLYKKGYDCSKPSLIIMEGVQMYLTEIQLFNLLKYISDYTGIGSIMFMDIINKKAFINSDYLREWKSGFDVPEQLFARIGWIPEIKQPGDPGASYGRYKSLPPRDKNFDIERVFLCTAQKVSQPCIFGLQHSTVDTVPVQAIEDS